jgi:O-antigen ligase
MPPHTTNPPTWRDWVLAFAGVLALTDVFDLPLYALFGPGAVLLPGMPLSRVTLLVPVLAAALLLAGHLRAAADQARAVWLLWPGVALTVVSAAWSDRPGTTLLWAAALLGTSAFGVALAVRFSPLRQFTLIAAVISGIALGSTLTAALWPAIGIGPRGWHGLYLHKNLLGRVMALGVTAAVIGALTAQPPALAHRRRQSGLAAHLVALSLCAGVLLATRSIAAILAASISVAATILLLAARRWRQHATAVLATGAAGTIFVFAFLLATRPGLGLVARSDTFSDRTRIWQTVAAVAWEARWIGRGYAAFWPGPAGQTTHNTLRMRMPVGHAHNGAVDLFAELGIAGLVLVLGPIAVFAAGALRHALVAGAPACVWPATAIVFFVASNAGESALLRHKLYWALYVAAACHAARTARGGLTTTEAEP